MRSEKANHMRYVKRIAMPAKRYARKPLGAGFQQLGMDAAWRDTVDGDVPWRQLACPRLRQSENRRFCRGIDARVLLSGQRPVRRRVDDPACTSLLHCRQYRLQCDNKAVNV